MEIDMDVLETFSTCFNFCAAMMFAGGVPVCMTYIEKKTTDRTSSFNFAVGFLLCCNWLVFGVIQENWNFVGISLVGSILHICYLITFVVYAPRKVYIIWQLGIIFMIMCTLIVLYLMFYVNPSGVGMRIFMQILLIIFFASPLTQLVHVVKTRSSETLPFMTIFFSCLLSILIFVYGCVLKGLDYVQIPNAIGIMFTAFGLLLFFIYPDRAQYQSTQLKA